MLYSKSALPLLISLTAVCGAPVRQQTRLVVFGDSFSDDGHGAWVASNGTWPPSVYYGHHFSNGPVWAQYLAGDLDLKLLDYATGGATSSNSVVQGYTGPTSTIEVPANQDQISRFIPKYGVNSHDLYTIFIGGNDFFFSPNITGEQVVSHIDAQVRDLAQRGGKRILLGTYYDLGAIPAAALSPPKANAVISGQTAQHRAALMQIASKWTAKGLKIQVIDVYQLGLDIQASPEKYGIAADNLGTSCLKGAYPAEGVPISVCDDPARYLYWDIYHPTTSVHRLVADLFRDAVEKLGN